MIGRSGDRVVWFQIPNAEDAIAAPKKTKHVTKHIKSKSKAGEVKTSVQFGRHSNKKMVKIVIRIPREHLTERLKALEK